MPAAKFAATGLAPLPLRNIEIIQVNLCFCEKSSRNDNYLHGLSSHHDEAEWQRDAVGAPRRSPMLSACRPG